MKHDPEIQKLIDEHAEWKRKHDRKIWIANTAFALIWGSVMIWLIFRALELKQ